MSFCPSIVSGSPHCYIHNSSNIVPVKYEQVVFCKLSELQLALYRLFISSKEIQSLLRGKGSQPLKAIGLLKKLCNHPALLELPKDLPGSDALLPEGYVENNSTTVKNIGGRERQSIVDCQSSGKFVVLERYVFPTKESNSIPKSRIRMLHHISTQTTDKIVLISNYTQTLDLMERLCRAKRLVHLSGLNPVF